MRRYANPGILLILLLVASFGVVTRVGVPGLSPTPLFAQAITAPPDASITPAPAGDLVYQCPMDPEYRSNQPGKCAICGMELRAGIPEPVEFPMEFSVAPQPVKVGAKETMTFIVHDPENDKQVKHFQIVHQKLFHMFVVSQDLKYFIHDHPVFGEDSNFRYDIAFPRPGMYRVLGDFCPDGASCQLNAKTVVVPGGSQTPATLVRDYGPKDTMGSKDGAPVAIPGTDAMKASITTEPQEPISGIETRIFLHLDNSEGLEQYIGAWSHMLAASDDLIDLVHSHPFTADGGPDMTFHVYFARAHVYRVWMQFQKKGAIHTVYFDIPVKDLD